MEVASFQVEAGNLFTISTAVDIFTHMAGREEQEKKLMNNSLVFEENSLSVYCMSSFPPNVSPTFFSFIGV